MTSLALFASPAVAAMGRRLTLPFARGADLLDLPLAPGADPRQATVLPYDFTEHQALYGRPPQPSYVVRLRGDAPVTANLRIDGTDQGGAFSVVVPLPTDLGDGDALAVPLPPTISAQARLTALRDDAATATAPASARWTVTALLGTTARLLWVLGAERDRLTRVARAVHDQRVVALAAGASLDLIGADLAVPRFPPRPYAVDAEAVALYHLDDPMGSVPAINDAAAAFPGRTAHHGTVAGAATLGRAGRYDSGVGFAGSGSITVASHADFDVAVAAGMTAEVFVQPASDSTLGTVLRRGPAAGPMWSLEVGDLGLGGKNSVRASVSDGVTTLVATAAVDLPTAGFSHVALVLAREPARARLSVFVDGQEIATATGAMGVIGGVGDVVIGPDASGFRGTLDEVRISSVARTGFAPVLGEDDEGYRGRLALFRRWELPTPDGLQAVLNRLVPEVDGVPDAFVVDDVDGASVGGTRVVRVWPASIAPMSSIDGDGRPGVGEASLWLAADDPIDAALLGRCIDPRIAFAPPRVDPGRDPALPVPDPRLMQPPVAAALTSLADLFDAAGMPNAVTVVGGFDAASGDARASGRGVLLAATVVAPGRLCALAHRAGFDLVEHRSGGVAYAACAPGRLLLTGPSGAGPLLQVDQAPEVTVGVPVTLEASLGTPTFAAATVPADAEVAFWLVGDAERATLVSTPGSITATLTPLAAGELSVSADVVRGGRTITVAVELRVLPAPLADGETITFDGTLGSPVAVVGEPSPSFDPAYLAHVDDPRLTVGPHPEDAQVDRGLLEPLTTLLDLLVAQGQPGILSLVSAYQPAAPASDPARDGRRLVLAHSVLGADRLAVLAHRAGFAWVGRDGSTVQVAGARGDQVGVDGPDELEVGQQVVLAVAPDPASVSPTTRLGWSSAQLVPTAPDGRGLDVMSATAPSVQVTGLAPGRAWVRATQRQAGAAGPYAFEVRLRPEAAGGHISLGEYHLLMNALHTLHPVGVEVLTEQIRSAVVELTGVTGGLDPSFTYPAFRLHRAVRSLRKDIPHG